MIESGKIIVEKVDLPYAFTDYEIELRIHNAEVPLDRIEERLWSGFDTKSFKTLPTSEFLVVLMLNILSLLTSVNFRTKT